MKDPADTEPPPKGLRLAVAAARSAAAYAYVSLYIALVGPPATLLARFLGNGALLFTLGHFGAEVGLRIAGVRYRLLGGERIPAGRPVVYCANHQSNLDPPIVFRALRPFHPHLRILFKSEMRKLPVFGRAMEQVGFVPVERGSREQSVAAVNAAIEAVRGGHSFLVFPEGTRSRTGELLPFKKGGFILAIGAGAPVVPLAVDGARNAMTPGSKVIRPTEVLIRVGQPIETSGLGFEDRDTLVEETRCQIKRMLSRE